MTPNGQYAFLDSNNLVGIFDEIYENEIAGDWAPAIGNAMPSDQAVEIYGWLGAAPTMDEIRGDMLEEQLPNFSYTLRNVEFGKSLKFKEVDMRRDKLGQIKLRIGDLAKKAKDHWNLLLSNLILNGSSAGYTSYDGVTFFNTAHAESGTSQVNALTSTHIPALGSNTVPASPTADVCAKVITSMIGKMYEFTDDKGDPINGDARSFQIQVGTAELWAPMSQALFGDRLSQGEANRLQGLTEHNGIKIDLLLNPRLRTANTNIFMFRTDSAVKPFVLQEEVPLDPIASTKANDEYVKYRRFLFNIYTSRNAGYFRWQSALKATLS